MSDKPYPNMSYGSGSSDFHSQPPCYDPSTSQTPNPYQRGAHSQHQNQYPAGSSYQSPANAHGHSSEPISSRVNPANVYPESSQRTFLGETMRDNMGYNSILNSFDAPHVASSSSNPYTFGALDISAPSAGDHTPSLSHIRYPPSRPSSQQSNMSLRKPTESSFPAMQLPPSSDYYPSTFSQSMTYSSVYGQSTNTESGTSSYGGHSLGSFSQDHRSAENSPPSSASPFQAGALGVDRLSSARFASTSHLQPPSGPTPISQPASIPMRKASSEWMTQSGFLPLPKQQGIGISHNKRYTSPAVAPGALLPDAFLGAEARASDLPPPKDADTYMDSLPLKRMKSPSLPSSHPRQREGASSKSTSPIPPEGLPSDGPPPKKKKKSKMHACEICNKKFPRPSGLKTHMNTHNNARPYACGFPGCNRTFGVRSNAKRHLRTHGVIPPPPGEGSSDAYVVGFSPPVVAPAAKHDHESVTEEAGDEHRSSKAPFFKLRWMPPSLTSRNNAGSLKSVSESGEFSDEEGDDEDDLDHPLLTPGREASGSLSDLSVPHLSPSRSSSATGSPDCGCTVPCGSTPCISLIASNLALSSRQPSSHSLDAFADAVPRIAKDIPLADPSSQVDTSHSF